MPTPTAIERLTVLADSMHGAALLILSGQHLGCLPTHYAAEHEQPRQLHPLNPELLRYERLRSAVNQGTKK